MDAANAVNPISYTFRDQSIDHTGDLDNSNRTKTRPSTDYKTSQGSSSSTTGTVADVVNGFGSSPSVEGGVNLGSSQPTHDAPDARIAIPAEPTGWLPGELIVCSLVPFLDWKSLVALMTTRQPMHRLLVSDSLWYHVLVDLFNLQPLLRQHSVCRDYYRFFIDMVVTTAALHGHYTFLVQPAPPPPPAAPAAAMGGHPRTPGGGLTLSLNRFNSPNSSASPPSFAASSGLPTFGQDRGGNEDANDVSSEAGQQAAGCDIVAVNLLLSAADLGQISHRIGRTQFLCTYKNEEMEVLQGSCRFSVARRCFSLCCNAFGNDTRGPVFTVAIATVQKPWAGESADHFVEHKGGLRLIMAPVLWEGQNPGSQISERDIIVVSRAPLAPADGANDDKKDVEGDVNARKIGSNGA